MSSNLNCIDADQPNSVTILDTVYPVERVEWNDPSHPFGGMATYYLGGNYEGYTMVVEYKRKLRNGKAIAYSSRGIVFIEVCYMDDVLHGEVVIRDERGVVLVNGTLHHGLREGVFTYKDKKDEYYYRGKQITPSSETDGYCIKDEKGQLVSVSQFNKDFSEIDGYSYEYKGGVLKRLCVYKQGKQVSVLKEWNGTKMTEFGPQGNRVYEGSFKGSLSEGFSRDGEGTEYHADGRSILYDGHWSKGMRSGKGSWYKNPNGLPTYIGTWDKNVPNGDGALMDKNGKELYSGNWKNGYLNVSGRKWVDFETESVSWKRNEKRLKKWGEREGEEPEACWKVGWRGFCTVMGWIADNWRDLIFISSLFLPFCTSFLFGYSLSRYGWWGWSCPVFYVVCFGLLFIALDQKYAPDDVEFAVPLFMRCLLGAISVASYHLFGPMASSGRKGAFITLIVICAIAGVVYLINIVVDYDGEDECVYPDVMNLLSFVSLSLVSSLLLSSLIIVVIIALKIIDYIFRGKAYVFWVVPSIELLYLTIVLMLEQPVLLVVTIVLVIVTAIAAFVIVVTG